MSYLKGKMCGLKAMSTLSVHTLYFGAVVPWAEVLTVWSMN